MSSAYMSQMEGDYVIPTQLYEESLTSLALLTY